MSGLDVAAYLERLDVQARGEPSIDALRVLHRAHVERVPYENLDIQLGRPTSVDPVEAAGRIVRGRGGYCFHLNGSFSALLRELGYAVTRHLGGVQRIAEDGARVNGGHMALTVRGLSDETCPDGVWFVDVGLGSALHEPVPLREGELRQGPFAYRLRRSQAVAHGWRFDHDPRGLFVGMDFRDEAAAVGDFAPMHEYFSTSPESGFVRVAVAQRRDAEGVDILRGLLLSRVGSAPSEALVESEVEWFGALADVFGLPLVDVDEAERRRLWRRVVEAHEEFERVQSGESGLDPTRRAGVDCELTD